MDDYLPHSKMADLCYATQQELESVKIAALIRAKEMIDAADSLENIAALLDIEGGFGAYEELNRISGILRQLAEGK